MSSDSGTNNRNNSSNNNENSSGNNYRNNNENDSQSNNESNNGCNNSNSNNSKNDDNKGNNKGNNQGLTPHEILELHELLNHEIVSMKKTQLSMSMVEDEELRNFVQESLNTKRNTVQQMQNFIKQSVLK